MLVKITEKGRKKAIRTESMPFFFEGIYWRFHYLYRAREEGKHAIELARRGAHPYFQKVFTPEGWKEWKDIHIGSKLYATDGSITTVTDIPYDDVAPYYKITLRDGRVVFASDDHLWKVIQHSHAGEQLYNTEELLSCYKKTKQISNRIPSGIEYTCGIPSNQGVNLQYSKTRVDPYTFGLLLGDGCFRHQSCYYTCSDEDFQEIKNYIPYKYTKWKYKCSYRLHIDNWKSILEEYKLYNLKSEDKFIPNEFLINSKEVRLELLRGLMDSDGYNHKSTPELCTTSKKLRDDILFLARSLGYNCQYTIKKAGYKNNGIYKECLPVYVITIYGGKEVFKLKRKQDKISYNSKRSLSRKVKTIITNIQFMGYYNCKCVTVDSKDSCYLIGDFITTHNCAKSYSLAAIMSHNLLLGESEESKKRVTTVLTAYEKEYLKDDKDGTLSKFKPDINFQWDNTPFPRLTTKNSPNEMSWVMGYKDEYDIEKGSLNMVLGVSAKDNPDKLRGKRGWILFEEMGLFKGLLALYDTTRKSVEDGDYTFALMYLLGCVCAGTKVWTPNGKYISIEDLTKEEGIVGFTPECTVTPDDNCSIALHRGITNEPITSAINVGKKECVSITLYNGNNLRCSKDHPILIQKHRSNHDGSISYYEEVFRNAGDLKVGDRVIESRAVPVFGTDALFDARLVGMLIGDGTYGSSGVSYCSEDKELWDYVESKYKFSIYHQHITKSGKTYKEGHINGISKELVKIGIKGQTKTHKRLPSNYQLLDRENTILLLSGLYDTDGSVYLHKKDWVITLTQSNREILEQVQILWRKFGVLCSISKINPRIEEGRKDKNPWYTLTISGRYSSSRASKILQLLVPHKKERLERIPSYYDSHPSRKAQKYPTDIIVSKVKSIAQIGENTVYNLTAGLSHTYLANNIVTHNTASEKESDFSSAKTLLYSPEGYNILSIKNVFDKPSQGKPTFGFFFPAYINRAGCFNENGVSDVVKALLQILVARYKAKYSTDPKSVLRVIAEDPITPAEAIIKVKAAYFPVAALNERLLQLDSNPNSFDDVYIGTLVQIDDKVEFRITGDTPIRQYGVPNDTEGALEIYQMPKRKLDGKVYENRYIIGHDPVDNDQAESSSLSSTFVFDLYTDTIVAEFTGRKPFADDNFEIVRLLCLFYNAKCMYEAHPYSQLVYTPDGPKQWKDIQIGDSLFSPTKGTVKVTDIPVNEEMDIYKITLSDGRVIEASDNHIWTVYEGTSKTQTNITTLQMLNRGIRTTHNQHKFFIPEHQGVEYAVKPLLIDPYTMGLILSEGSIRGTHCTKNYIQISSNMEDMLFYQNNIPYQVKHIGSKGYSWHLYIPGCKNIMMNYNLYGTDSHTKFIPSDYLYSHRVQRMELLKGIMDGDGCARTKGASIFITCSERLANDVLSLVRSLGIKGWLQTSRNGVYRVAIASQYKVFKLPRKVVDQYVYRPYIKGSKASAILNKTAVEKIEFSHREMGKCVTVDSKDGLYLIGDYVVTHNCNKKGIFAYFKTMNCTHLLAETPEYLRDMEFIKYNNFGSNRYGIAATAAINTYANSLIRDWLLKPTTVIVKDEEGKEVESTQLMLTTVKSRGLLEELIQFQPELNVDRIRALGMVMLYRQEKIVLYQGNLNEQAQEKIEATYLGNDDFFSRNYDRKVKISDQQNRLPLNIKITQGNQ